MTLGSMILRGTSKKYKYLGENEIKNETILTHWSVGQAGSNDEKNWGSKISLDCPFNIFILFPKQTCADSVCHSPVLYRLSISSHLLIIW